MFYINLRDVNLSSITGNTKTSGIQFYSIYIGKDRYELSLPIRVSEFITDTETTILYKLRNDSSTYIRIHINNDYGFYVDNDDEELFDSNTTYSERRVVKGFIRDYQNEIKRICRGNPADLVHLNGFLRGAIDYNTEPLPKNTRQRRIERKSIFSNVVFI